MTNRLKLPLWADLHTHFRQGEMIDILAQEYSKMGCYAALAMPNTAPPVGKVLGSDMSTNQDFWSIEKYRNNVLEAFKGKAEEIIVPLYITKHTTPQMIEEGAKSGLLKAAKYYPPHGTTNSDYSRPISEIIGSDTLKALEDNEVILCIHGEEHSCSAQQYFDREDNAETIFYKNIMPKLVESHPNLKMVAEHITTKVAVDFVKNYDGNIAASITPQHLLYTIGNLLLKRSAHLVCMPYVKFEQDREALRAAATDINNTKFFAGTDNAPHPKLAKQTDCGCAAGCYVAGIAPQLYAMAFEEYGVNLLSEQGGKAFQKFLCDIGPEFYALPKPKGSFELVKESSKVEITKFKDDEIVPLPCGLVSEKARGDVTIPWSVNLL